MKRFWRAAALLMVFALVAAACGDDADDDTTTSAAPGTTEAATTTTEATIAAIPGLVDDGKLIVVTTGNFPPFTAIDPDTGDNVGYTIDIVREIANRLGLELELPTVDFVAELEGLANGLYDIADSGIWPNAARQEAGFVFSIPMTSTGIVAQVRSEDAATSPGLTAGAMAGLDVGGIQGSSQEKFILDNEATLGYDSYSGFTGAAEGLTALRQGRVDVLSQDTLVAGFASVTFDDLGVAGPTVEAHPLSLTFKNGNEALRDAIDPVISDMIADGTLGEIQKTWFGACIPVPTDINAAPPYTAMPGGDCGDPVDAAPAIPDLVDDGKLIVVTTGNFPPFTAIDPDTGDNVGYSIDIVREIALRAGLELELPTVDFVAELEGLANGLYDIADSGIWPNAARQEAGFVFSIPMTSTGIVAQVRSEDAATSPGLAEGAMAGLDVGGIQGSSQEKFILDNEATLGYDSYSGFTGAAEGLTALRQGRVDVLSQDTLVAGFASVTFDDLGVAGPTVEAHPLSLTFRTGNEAKRDAIDFYVRQIIADGTLAAIQIKWFGACIPVPGDINAAAPYTTMPGGDC